MSNSNNCPDCGGHDGNHYNDCIYDGIKGNAGLGGDSTEKVIFAIFCIVGIILGAMCPPLGAFVIVIGMMITGV